MRILPRILSQLFGFILSFLTTGVVSVGVANQLSGQAFDVRDSTGVKIITIPGPLPEEGSKWVISSMPVLQIGEVEGGAPYLFVGLWDALRVPDGRIVAVDGGSFEIHVFGSDGAHRGTFGGRGDGPEEFGGPPWVSLARPDTLVVWDPGHFRLSRFDLSGELLNQVPLSKLVNSLDIPPLSNGRVWQVASNGILLSTGSGPGGLPGPGLKDSERRILIVDGYRDTGIDLGEYPSGGTLWERTSDGGLTGLPNPYAPYSAVGLGPEPLLVTIADPRRWELRSFDRNGDLRRVLRSSFTSVAVTSEMRTRERERELKLAEAMGIPRVDAERALANLPVPEVLPPIGSLFWDNSNNLWVGRRAGSFLSRPERYDVFDESGRWVASVNLPDNILELFEVGEDYVLASWQDDLDVVYLRLYGLSKTER